MDKASVALSATEDNAAAIRALSRELKRRTVNTFIFSKQITVGMLTFGNVESDGKTAVLFMYTGTNKRKIYFCNKEIEYVMSPTFTILPEGKGELRIQGSTAAPAWAFIFGADTKTVYKSSL